MVNGKWQIEWQQAAGAHSDGVQHARAVRLAVRGPLPLVHYSPFTISPIESYLTVTVTGLNCNWIGPPSGVLATPLTWMIDPPGPTASKSSAASSPAPDAPV